MKCFLYSSHHVIGEHYGGLILGGGGCPRGLATPLRQPGMRATHSISSANGQWLMVNGKFGVAITELSLYIYLIRLYLGYNAMCNRRLTVEPGNYNSRARGLSEDPQSLDFTKIALNSKLPRFDGPKIAHCVSTRRW